MTDNSRDKSQHYDLTYLEELSAGDPSFVKSILTQFISEAPDVIIKIKTSALEKNWYELNYQMHKFATNLAFVGLNDIKDELNKVEIFSKNKTNLDEIPHLVNIILQRCELAIISLKKDFEL